MSILRKIVLTMALLVVTGWVIAAQEEDEAQAKYESVVANCESQYTAELYPDEDDRAAKIEACIDAGSPQGEDRG